MTTATANPLNYGYAVISATSYAWVATLEAAQEMAAKAPGTTVQPAHRPGIQID